MPICIDIFSFTIAASVGSPIYADLCTLMYVYIVFEMY